ncbi:MAG: hemolysin family protein [Roseburia sp.]
MDDGVSPAIGTLILVVLVLLDAIIFGFIAAMQNLNEALVEKQEKEGDKRARLLSGYMDKSDRYTHVCQLVMLTIHMLIGFLQVPLWEHSFLTEGGGMLIRVLTDILIFAVLIVIVLVFGIYTPEKVASRKPDIWARRLVYAVRGVELFFFPLIFLMDALANLLSRILGVDPLSGTDDVTEEEIISMVNEGHEHGVLLASEAEMIHNIFEFGDKEAQDIMTHRKNMVALDGALSFRETLAILKESNYSRFPVYLEDVDNIIGLLHIKEALDFCQEPELLDLPIKDIDGLIRDVDFIPETRNINTLFNMMQAAKSHMVIVVDEYGQTSGIVALEDILEEIVGNIEDEHDEEEQMIQKLSDGDYLMNGMAEFSDVVDELGMEFSEDEDDDFDTLNGFLISLIDKIPNDNDVFSTTACGYLFEILSVKNKMIASVHVSKLPEESSADGTQDVSCRKDEDVV